MSKSKLIVHLGGPKTGSSALQTFLARNETRLRSNGVLAPRAENHYQAKSGVRTSGNGGLLLDAAHLESVCCRHAGKTYLYSSDDLFPGLLEEEARTRLMRLADKRGYELTFVIATRNFFEFTVSAWNQLVKTSSYTKTYSDYLFDDSISKNGTWPNCFTPQNFEVLLKWMDLARRDNLDVRVFNYDKQRNALIPYFFETYLNLSAPKSNDDSQDRARVNRSLTTNELKVQLAFNRQSLQHTARFISDPLIEKLPELTIGWPYFSEEAYLRVVDKFKGVVERINEYSGDDLIAFTRYEDLRQRFDSQLSSEIVLSEKQLEILATSISKKIEMLQNPSRKKMLYLGVASLIPGFIKAVVPSAIKNSAFRKISKS